MAVVGSFGGIVFEASRERVRSFEGLTHEGGTRIDSTDIIGGEPITSFGGPGGETVSFTIRLSADLGVNPQFDYDLLNSYRVTGRVSAFVLGGKPFRGSGARWIIESLSGSFPVFTRSGKARWIDCSVTLRKYVTVAARRKGS